MTQLRDSWETKKNQNVGIFQKVFQSMPCLMDGSNFNMWRDLGCTKTRLVVSVFVYENHRQTSTVDRIDRHRPPTENTKNGVYESHIR